MMDSSRCHFTTGHGGQCSRAISTFYRGTPCCGIHRNAEMMKEDCPICMCSLKDEDVMTLSCDHAFHKDCITQVTSPVCPMCRAPFTGNDLETFVTKRCGHLITKICNYIPHTNIDATINLLSRGVDVIAVGGPMVADGISAMYSHLINGASNITYGAYANVLNAVGSMFSVFGRDRGFDRLVISGEGEELYVDDEIFGGGVSGDGSEGGQYGVISGNVVMPAPTQGFISDVVEPSYSPLDVDAPIESNEQPEQQPVAVVEVNGVIMIDQGDFVPMYTRASNIPLGSNVAIDVA